MMTTKFMVFDFEELERSMDRMLEESGGTEGYIGQVTLGPAIREAQPPGTHTFTDQTGPSSRPPPGAAPAPPRRDARTAPSPPEAALLDAIHGHIIGALARLPTSAARGHAWGVVLAGHCYGCLAGDPTSNVLANALWYDAAFPPRGERPAVHRVGAAALYRCARRSLDGIVAFMRRYCPDVPADKALRCLEAAKADLAAAVRMATGEDAFSVGAVSSARARDAFQHAATAARHPDPAAYAWFAECLMGTAVEAATMRSHMMAASTAALSQAAVEEVSAALRRVHGDHTPAPPAPPLSRGARCAVDLVTNRHQMSADTVIAELAIQKHAAESDQELELHFVCGHHQFFNGRHTFHHVNFLARRKATQLAGEPGALFFAEANALARDASDVTLCCPVPPSQGPGGCSACEYGGRRLVHPAGEEFNGRVGFSDGEDPVVVELFKKNPDSELSVPLDEDYVFFDDAGLQPEMATFLELEHRYAAMEDVQVYFSFCSFS